MTHKWLTVSVDGHQPTYRGLYIAIISYPVIKGGVSFYIAPQYSWSTQRHIYWESQDLMSAGRSTADASISRTKNGVLGALPKTNSSSLKMVVSKFGISKLQGEKPLFSGGPHLLLVSGSVSIPEFGSNQRCGGPDHPLVGPHPSKLNKRLLRNIYHLKSSLATIISLGSMLKFQGCFFWFRSFRYCFCWIPIFCTSSLGIPMNQQIFRIRCCSKMCSPPGPGGGGRSKLQYLGAFRSNSAPTMPDVSHEKYPGCLGYVRDYTTQLYRDYKKPL